MGSLIHHQMGIRDSTTVEAGLICPARTTATMAQTPAPPAAATSWPVEVSAVSYTHLDVYKRQQ